jgi:hypothetical protein
LTPNQNTANPQKTQREISAKLARKIQIEGEIANYIKEITCVKKFSEKAPTSLTEGLTEVGKKWEMSGKNDQSER